MTQEEKELKMEDNKQLEIEYKAIQVALDMYDKFAHELITALTNIGDCYNQTKWTCRDVQSISYYQGKQDAFGEIAERVNKEYGLIKQNMNSLYFEQPWSGNDDGHIVDREKRMVLINNVMNSIKHRKNKDVDKLIPDNKFIGRKEFDYIMQLKGRIADLLEGYGMEGFRLGIVNERKYREHLSEDTLVDEFESLLENDKKDMVFEPNKFAKELSETVIPKEYIDVINDERNIGLMFRP